jgi:hypothetical protein
VHVFLSSGKSGRMHRRRRQTKMKESWKSHGGIEKK